MAMEKHGENHPPSAPPFRDLNGGIRRLEEILGFAVIVEGIVYGVYSSAQESDYIADSLRASGLICEICHYE